jgi:hypothetical protein
VTTTSGSTKGRPEPVFPLPPADFNPLQSPPEEIATYGLPPKPDGDKQPALLKAWERLFQYPYTRVPPPFHDITIDPLEQDPNIRQIVQTRFHKSANWCGASITANGGNQFVLLFGEWKVPKPELPPRPERTSKGRANKYRCVTWIGIDGNRRYLNSSLPQIGTEQILKVDRHGNETLEYFAWFQWWARTELKITRYKLPLTICENLPVMAMIWVVDQYHVVAALRTYGDLNQIFILYEEAPDVSSTTENTPTIKPAISGATVEWIHERPLKNGKPSPFAKFTPVQFCHCVAGTGPTAGKLTSEQRLAGPRLLRMFDVPRLRPARARLTSMPRWITETSIEVQYGDFPD